MRSLIRGALFLTVVALAAASPRGQQISFDRLLRADREPQNWLSYSGTVFNQRYSQLTQITPANVNRLVPQWTFQGDQPDNMRGTSASPIGRSVIFIDISR